MNDYTKETEELRYAEGWNDCLKEVLKILKSHTRVFKRDVDDGQNGIVESKETHIYPCEHEIKALKKTGVYGLKS